MRSKLTQQILGTIFTIGALIATGNTAQAAGFASCSGKGYDISATVSGAESCSVSTDYNQDDLTTDPMTVNIDPGFFDETNWEFGGKIGVDSGYLGEGSGQSGTFDFSSIDTSAWDDVMLVFKDGSGTYLTGYLLLDGVTSGTWTTPFKTEANGSIYNFKGGNKDVSHISVYYTLSTSSSTPLPTVHTAAPKSEQIAGLVLAIGATGYLLLDGGTSETWTTPFETEAKGSIDNFKGGNKDVSHISAYYTLSTSSSTPLPTVHTAAAPEGEQIAGLVLAIGATGYLKRKFR